MKTSNPNHTNRPSFQFSVEPSFTDRTELQRYLAEISRTSLLSTEQEVEVATRAAAGDRSAQNKLIAANLRFVVSMAKLFQKKGVPLADLVQYGNEGLIRAAQKYDVTRGVKFTSYAVWWVRNTILDGLSKNENCIYLPANRFADIHRVEEATALYMNENGQAPSLEDLTSLTGMSEEDILFALGNKYTAISADKPLSDDSECTWADMYATDDFAADRGADRQSLTEDVDYALSKLGGREELVLRKYFGIGCEQMNPEEISREFDISRERIRQIFAKAIREIRNSPARDTLRGYVA